MLKALDEKIIEKLTKFSHWFQKLTGLTCYFFAKTGIFIAFLGLVIRVINYFKPILAAKSNLFDIFLLFFFGLVFLRDIYLCNKAEESIFSSEATKIENQGFGLRIFCLLLLVLNITFLLLFIYKASYIMLEVVGEIGFWVGITIYNYFVEVTPLPPGKSKIRQWVEGLFSTQPQLEPIPIKPD